MLRKFIFKSADGFELVLPVTPEGYKIESGMKIETIGIHALGDVNMAGNTTLCAISFDFILPTSKRGYTNGTPQSPDSYLDRLKKWISEKSVVRFIVSDTKINIPVLVETVSYGEQDGTNDIYASISLREYRQPTAAKMGGGVQNNSRPVPTVPQTANTYIIKKHDTLSAICRKAYGNAQLYPKLASYNGIKNPNLIYTGAVLKLPPVSQL